MSASCSLSEEERGSRRGLCCAVGDSNSPYQAKLASDFAARSILSLLFWRRILSSTKQAAAMFSCEHGVGRRSMALPRGSSGCGWRDGERESWSMSWRVMSDEHEVTRTLVARRPARRVTLTAYPYRTTYRTYLGKDLSESNAIEYPTALYRTV